MTKGVRDANGRLAELHCLTFGLLTIVIRIAYGYHSGLDYILRLRRKLDQKYFNIIVFVLIGIIFFTFNPNWAIKL